MSNERAAARDLAFHLALDLGTVGALVRLHAPFCDRDLGWLRARDLLLCLRL
ncbi:hypothetical protein [Actinokineospora inagensis]|uniref:hypothetical protein n=1 Tax=Actinokineospora inagensis TaxID=103730 RepID=UPI0012F97C8A|nr:hypothetical protein [Actinokineospora inagensis]